MFAPNFFLIRQAGTVDEYPYLNPCSTSYKMTYLTGTMTATLFSTFLWTATFLPIFKAFAVVVNPWCPGCVDVDRHVNVYAHAIADGHRDGLVVGWVNHRGCCTFQ